VFTTSFFFSFPLRFSDNRFFLFRQLRSPPSDPSEMLLDANSLQAQRKELLEVAGTSDSTPAVPANAKKSGVRRALPVGSAVRANKSPMELDSSMCFSDLSCCFREERG